jgi:hypothetical protein
MTDQRKQVDIDYINWRGERAKRRIEPITGQLVFNYNSYHSTPCWLLLALDISGDGTIKTFAMKQIHSWIEMPAAGPIPPIPKHPKKL